MATVDVAVSSDLNPDQAWALASDLRRFEDRARRAGVINETVLAARYALCATLDEAVLATPWGAQSEWAQQTLLVALHREAWGGEKFFDMLERICADPQYMQMRLWRLDLVPPLPARR